MGFKGVIQKRGAGVGSSIATLMFVYAMFQQYFPRLLPQTIERFAHGLIAYFNPYIHVTIHEKTGEHFTSAAYIAIKNYLSINSSKQAKRLKADIGKNSKTITLSMDDYEQITDEYQGIRFWWSSHKTSSKSQSFSMYPANDNRYYKLTFHRKHRELVTDSYLTHVIQVGKAVGMKNRQRKLYTNNSSTNWNGLKTSVWSHVFFHHPSTFQTLAMDAEKKRDIMEDLTTFSTGKDYYAKIGKAWKRGYLLYGPPGTGKSTMIAAIANFLDYDIYDVELTSVKNNTELRKLLTETSNKSLIVIEDIDCSLDLTGQRKKKKAKEAAEDGENLNPIAKMAKEYGRSVERKVTLSGLLNFIDGLWSACGEERIILFTTNHVDKLDPALIRRGRMDKHIEMSYCSFEAFQVLAKNYLDLESHPLFETVQELLGETQITPADVAENLMPKTTTGDVAQLCLENLIQALKDKKEKAMLKAKKKEKARKAPTKDEANAAESSTKNEAKENDSGLLETKEMSTKAEVIVENVPN